MLKHVLLLLLSISTFVPARSGCAGILLSIDVDDVIPGIQSNVIVSPGSTIIAGIYAELTGSTSVATFSYSVQFDTSELSFVSRSETPEALIGLTELDTVNFNNLGIGLLTRFDGTTFFDGPVGPFGPVRIGQIVFTAVSPSGNAGEFDILPGLFEGGFDEFYDNGFSNITDQVTFLGGSVSIASVPEPSSLVLASTLGLTSLLVHRRKRKRIDFKAVL